MGGKANHQGVLNLTTTISWWQQLVACIVSVISGTVGSFNTYGKGSQNFNHAVINSGKNSGANQASKESSTRKILPKSQCSGTQSSFDCYEEVSQHFKGATTNRGENSGNRPRRGSRSTTSEQQDRLSHCSGTQNSFNCYEEGSQDFSGATINSGENSGNPPRSGSRSTTSEQQDRVTVTGTRDSFNNYGNWSSTSTTVVRNTLRKLQNFKDAIINSDQNSEHS